MLNPLPNELRDLIEVQTKVAVEFEKIAEALIDIEKTGEADHRIIKDEIRKVNLGVLHLKFIYGAVMAVILLFGILMAFAKFMTG